MKKLHAVLDVDVRCDDCNWTLNSKNGLGVAARHTKKTGHTTHVETVRSMTFCDDNSQYWQDYLERQREGR